MNEPTITIIDTIPLHLRMMANEMSADSANMAKHIGTTPLKALWNSYRESIICKTAFIDNRIAAIWGLSGVLFYDTASPWLILTPETRKYPMRVAFRFKRELNEMLKMFPILEDYVDEKNDKAMRMLKLMGFKIDKNRIPLGEVMFRRAEKRV